MSVTAAKHFIHNGHPLHYDGFKPRSFNCIMSYEKLPNGCRKEEFRHQTEFRVMDPLDNIVRWNEGKITMGKIYSLDCVFSIRIFLDTTVFAVGKTTPIGRYEIPLKELVRKKASQDDSAVAGAWYPVKNGSFSAELFLIFEFEYEPSREHSLKPCGDGVDAVGSDVDVTATSECTGHSVTIDQLIQEEAGLRYRPYRPNSSSSSQ